MSDIENARTYRFKISNIELYEDMVGFAHTNQFLDKQDLKDKYEEWLDLPEINTLISEEEELLRRQEYDLQKTNIKQKIFKSIKYYHIKNLTEDRKMKNSPNTRMSNETTISTENINKKKSVSFSRELIEKVKEELLLATELKPSVCCKEFMTKHSLLLTVERENNEEIDNFNEKFKKMFKNQWFMKFKK